MAKKKSPSTARGSSRSSKRSSKKRSRSSSKKSRAAKRGGINLSPNRKRDLLGLFLAGLGLFTTISILSPQQGFLTEAWLNILKQGFGWGMYVLAPALIAGGILLIMRSFGRSWARIDMEQFLGSVVLYLALLILLHAFLNGDDLAGRLALGRQGRGGGVVGAALLSALVKAVGGGGTLIVMVAWVLLGVMLVAGLSIPELFAYGLRFLRWVLDKLREAYQAWKPKGRPVQPEPQEQAPPVRRSMQSETESSAEVSSVPRAPQPALEPVKTEPTSWSLPTLESILEPGSAGKVDQAFDRERGRLIEETLRSFGAPARVVEINRGPTITQFGVEPDYIDGRRGRRTKVKVSKIKSLADDLALALAASSIRIEAPVPGKGFLGIEVPNAEIALVSLRDVMESKDFEKISGKLRLGLGQDVSGRAVAADLGIMPHLLIAGTTGSGKSVCINSIATCLLLQNRPDELKFVMIDPKRVELTNFNGIPHLLAPVVVELDRVIGALQWVSREMDERYQRFAKEGVRNIGEYNKRMDLTDRQILPYLVVVIDELADLMMLAPDETERVVTRLAQLARATGIHLVIATQRPSVDVVTGLIKANFPARVAFAVASSVDSRVILDQPGAERLLGRGDMLFQAPDAAAPVRMQGSFVSEPELFRLIRFWKNQALSGGEPSSAPAKEEEVPQPDKPPKQAPLWEEMAPEDDQVDELYNDAVAVFREEHRASISLLQRRLRIGYTRAARIVDAMEEQGIVGPDKGGSQGREVLDYGPMTPQEGEE